MTKSKKSNPLIQVHQGAPPKRSKRRRLLDFPADSFDLERGLRSVACLMEQLSDGDAIRVPLSQISRALEKYAEFVALERSKHSPVAPAVSN
jgi:hypothetical protein